MIRSHVVVGLLILQGCLRVSAPSTAASASHVGGQVPGEARGEITCLPGPTQQWSEREAEHVGALFDQTMRFLRGYRDRLDARAEYQAVVATYPSRRTRSLAEMEDLALLRRQLDVVLDHPEAARRCFDPTMAAVSEDFRGFSPGAGLMDRSTAAAWLERPLYSEHFDESSPLHENLRAFGEEFTEILGAVQTPASWNTRMDPTALPDLWAGVGWVPFYVGRPEAGARRFRGGYAYAEVMGPWGMLRIDEIEGERFQGEIGMTVQRTDTFYPAHFHHAPETYMPLDVVGCSDPGSFLLAPPGYEPDANSAKASEPYRPMAASEAPVIYIERGFWHSFSTVHGAKGKQDGPVCAMVAVWARTVVRDGLDQTTHLFGSASVAAASFEGTKRIRGTDTGAVVH